MYNEHFGFSEAPFSIAPDPRYLYMSERHREALAHLLYGLRIDGGFVLLSGEVGTGKTTICRCLLEQVPGDCDIAYILNPKLDTVELLATLCDELHIPLAPGCASVKTLTDLVNQHLLAANAAGRKTVLIVDEAQNLSNEVLEQLRLLTNLETNERKLLQIMLLGQPELRERLARADMRQLAQRIVARYHLEPLSRPEMAAYVEHRLAVAGCRRSIFPPAVIDRLHRLTGGTPRLVNVICDRALLGAFVENRASVDVAILDRAAREVLGAPPPRQASGKAFAVAGALVLVAALGVLSGYHEYGSPDVVRNLGTAPAGAEAAAFPGGLSMQVAAHDGPLQTIMWPAESDPWLQEVQAVRALLKQWRLELPPAGIESACQAAQTQGFVCLRRVDDFPLLRGMDAPAILELRAADELTFRAALLSLDADTALLSIGGVEHRVAVEKLRQQWTGAYTLLWRPPPGWSRSVAPGQRGPDVAWVVRQLDRWQGLPESTAASAFFTDDLALRVKAFQRAHGLQEDGVIGPMTLVRLTAMADPDTPTLARRAR